MKFVIFPELEKPLKNQHIQLARLLSVYQKSLNCYILNKIFVDYWHPQMFSHNFSPLINNWRYKTTKNCLSPCNCESFPPNIHKVTSCESFVPRILCTIWYLLHVFKHSKVIYRIVFLKIYVVHIMTSFLMLSHKYVVSDQKVFWFSDFHTIAKVITWLLFSSATNIISN